MDSLTQITLGAAVGEMVLGRKVGNRAMLWGAIGGTIPDLDVFANLSTDPIGALAFHRSISHSMTFAVLAPVALGWLVWRLYERGAIRSWWRELGLVTLGLAFLLWIGAFVLPIPRPDTPITALAVAIGMMSLPVVVGLRERWRRRPSSNPNASWQGWSWLFFASIFTHPLLDCCTDYGTQLFQPFLDYRVAFNNISVVDPLYTVPFAICVLIASRMTRGSRRRRLVNYIGIGLSSAYLVFTFANKSRVDRIFESSLQEQKISYHRFTTEPTLFNNILWQGVAEGDTSFYYGMYSLLDEEPRIKWFLKVPKNHQLLAPYQNDRTVEVLEWFSKGYYSVKDLPDDRLQFNDLRFGLLERGKVPEPHFVFKFTLEEKEGHLEAYQEEATRRDLDGAFEQLWTRLQGI